MARPVGCTVRLLGRSSSLRRSITSASETHMHLTMSGYLTRALAAAAGLLVLAGAPLAAQQAAPTGRITGRLLDAATGQGIASVGIQVVGTTLGAMSGIDGRYTVTNIPAGTVTIQARRIGYQP